MNGVLLLAMLGALILILDWIFNYCSNEGFVIILIATLLLNWLGISEIEKSNEKSHALIVFAFVLYPGIFWSGYNRYLNWKEKQK